MHPAAACNTSALLRRCCAALLLLLPLAARAAPADDALAAERRGAPAAAAQAWLVAAHSSGDDAEAARFELRAAAALIEAGHLERAAETLGAAQAHHGPSPELALLRGRLQLRRGDAAGALALLETARTAISDPPLAARVDLELGTALAAAGRSDAALARLTAAAMADDHAVSARAHIEAARLDSRAGANHLRAAAGHTATLPPEHARAFLEIALGRGWQAIGDSTEARAAFLRAADTAQTAGDHLAASYAAGYRSDLAGTADPERALDLARRALFEAQQVDAPEAAYRWEWQIARLHARNGDRDDAIAAYQRAVETLERVRSDLAAALPAGSGFRAAVGALYQESADLLLQRAAAGADATRDMIAARSTLERLKQAELQDYFQDDCVSAFLSKRTGLDTPPPRTAILYTVLFPERTVLLIQLPAGLRQVVIPARESEIAAQAQQLRALLEKRTSRQYLPYARRLYDLMIAPAEPLLADVDTLVIVPDGPLRTIPFAALHDGRQFLMERYALAVAPGLTLTDPRPLSGRNFELLLGGLTRGVQGFPPLPNVGDELESVHALLGGTVLQDGRFVVRGLEQEIAGRPYQIVHVASHGQFGARADESFLLTYDARLDMNRLEQLLGMTRLREEAVELLTLSACQTAAGDERAALGLAGVAVKAGARSALATLWFINDRASAELVAEFYRQLARPGSSRAQALRAAQRHMLADPRYAHPAYWAPFLLIGNWL